MMRGQRRWLEDSREYVRWREGIQSIIDPSLLLIQPPARMGLSYFYLPLRFEGVQINKLPHYIVIIKCRSILLEEPIAYLCILSLWDRVLDVCFLETIERDNYTVYLCERVI